MNKKEYKPTKLNKKKLKKYLNGGKTNSQK